MQEKYFEFEGKRIIYFESNAKGSEKKKRILLMHGYSFNSSVWDSFGFVDFLEGIGYAPLALDIPGFPKSSNKENMQEEKILELRNLLIKNIVNGKPVLLGASASGYLALKFAEANSKSISAVIAVGPVGMDSINLAKITVPVLGIWGSEDKVSDPDSGKCKLKSIGETAIIKGARHACYLDKPEEFKKIVSSFLSSIEAK